jgi:hypothetical protein
VGIEGRKLAACSTNGPRHLGVAIPISDLTLEQLKTLKTTGTDSPSFEVNILKLFIMSTLAHPSCLIFICFPTKTLSYGCANAPIGAPAGWYVSEVPPVWPQPLPVLHPSPHAQLEPKS